MISVADFPGYIEETLHWKLGEFLFSITGVTGKRVTLVGGDKAGITIYNTFLTHFMLILIFDYFYHQSLLVCLEVTLFIIFLSGVLNYFGVITSNRPICC